MSQDLRAYVSAVHESDIGDIREGIQEEFECPLIDSLVLLAGGPVFQESTMNSAI